MHTIIWRFTIDPANAAAFERHYSANGTWAALFRRSPAYRGSELMRDVDQTGVYLTLDHWADDAAFADFKAKHGESYRDLDAQLEKLTLREERLISFDN